MALFVVLMAWVVGCSVSDPAEEGAAPDFDALERSCRDELPELGACRSFVAHGVHQERIAELLERLDRLPDEPGSGWATPYLIGYVHYMSGGESSAMLAGEGFREADRRAARAGSAEGRAESLLMLGALAEFDEGDIEAALGLYERSAEHADAGRDRTLAAQAAWAAASACSEQGRYTVQIDWLFRALDRIGDPGDPAFRRIVLYALANAHRVLGDSSTARGYLDEMLASALRDEDVQEEVYALQLLGVVELDRDPDAAIPWFEKCAARAAEAGFPGIAAHAEVLKGVALVQGGRLTEGGEALSAILDRSMQYAEQDVELRVQGLANLQFLAEAERRLGNTELALDLYGRARALSVEWRKPYFEWQVSTGLAALHLAERNWTEAIAEARRGVDEVESVRAALREEGQRLHYLRQRSSVYATLASAFEHLEPGASDQPFALMEDVHARTLRESLRERTDDSIPEHSVSLAEVRSKLAKDDLLLEYLLGEEESLLLAVTQASARLHRLPGRAKLEQIVEQYRRVLKRPLTSLDARLDPEADFRRTAGPGFELYRALLGPVSREIAAASRLIVVPDKQLHRLPFEALLVESPEAGPLRFLAESHAVAYLPSASLLVGPGRAAGGQVVVVAAGEARPSLGLAELTEVPLEVEGILASYPADRVEVLRGRAATPEAVAEALDDEVSTLHLLGHALLDPASGPEIVLSARDADGHALLTATEIVAMAPTPPLVVLSACETAEGELVGGEGILGLVRAFQLAGSSQTIASLWQADDAVAARLMAEFHRGLRAGMSPSLALAAARRAQLGGGFVHPFGWAGFVLYGAD